MILWFGRLTPRSLHNCGKDVTGEGNDAVSGESGNDDISDGAPKTPSAAGQETTPPRAAATRSMAIPGPKRHEAELPVLLQQRTNKPDKAGHVLAFPVSNTWPSFNSTM